MLVLVDIFLVVLMDETTLYVETKCLLVGYCITTGFTIWLVSEWLQTQVYIDQST